MLTHLNEPIYIYIYISANFFAHNKIMQKLLRSIYLFIKNYKITQTEKIEDFSNLRTHILSKTFLLREKDQKLNKNYSYHFHH